jgi:hypothetical protein
VENQTWRERTQNASKITLCVAASREFGGRWVLQPIIATGIISIKDKVLRRKVSPPDDPVSEVDTPGRSLKIGYFCTHPA